jgi:hypothetical protein
MSQASTSNKHARGWTQALARAAEAGDARLVGELLAAGATADVRLEGGATPLMRAAARGFADVARVLLDADADVNARRGDGFTPLILAVFFGHEEVVRLLLERGADPSAETSLGVSARGWAGARGFKAIGELLRQTPQAHGRTAPATRSRVAAVVARTGVGAAAFEGVSVRPDAGGGVRARLGTEAAPEPVAPAGPRGPATAREATPYEPQFYTPARGFAWSWQASVGIVLLVAACGVGGLALWQRSRGGANASGTPTPAAGATQAARPLPTPSAPDAAAQLTPTPFVDPQAGALPPDMPGAVVIQPDPSVQPVMTTPDPAGATSSSVPSVVSESGAAPTPVGPTPRREPRDPRDDAPTPDAPAGRREDARRPDEDPRPADAVRRDLETQPPPPPSNPPPAPTATPRRRVIQWPP